MHLKGDSMTTLFSDACRTHQFGNVTMMAGLLLLATGVLGGYVWNSYLGLLLQVFAHVLVILGPTLIKIGYVMRINARHRLQLAY